MARAKQLSFNQIEKERLEFGGSKFKGHAKLARPLTTKKSIHLVIKSELAKGEWSFLKFRNRQYIENLIRQKAKLYQVSIEDFANGGDHLHLRIRIFVREKFKTFLKVINGMIAKHVTGAKKGKRVGRFWTGIAFSRIVKSAIEVLTLNGYFRANRIEAERGRELREQFLKVYNAEVRIVKTGGRPGPWIIKTRPNALVV